MRPRQTARALFHKRGEDVTGLPTGMHFKFILFFSLLFATTAAAAATTAAVPAILFPCYSLLLLLPEVEKKVIPEVGFEPTRAFAHWSLSPTP